VHGHLLLRAYKHRSGIVQCSKKHRQKVWTLWSGMCAHSPLPSSLFLALCAQLGHTYRHHLTPAGTKPHVDWTFRVNNNLFWNATKTRTRPDWAVSHQLLIEHISSLSLTNSSKRTGHMWVIEAKGLSVIWLQHQPTQEHRGYRTFTTYNLGFGYTASYVHVSYSSPHSRSNSMKPKPYRNLI